jgi:hypothetical protein
MKIFFAILCLAASFFCISAQAQTQTINTSNCTWRVVYQGGFYKTSVLNCSSIGLGDVLTKNENSNTGTCSLSASSPYSVSGTCSSFTLTKSDTTPTTPTGTLTPIDIRNCYWDLANTFWCPLPRSGGVDWTNIASRYRSILLVCRHVQANPGFRINSSGCTITAAYKVN